MCVYGLDYVKSIIFKIVNNKDTGLLIASLDEEAQEDLRANKNLGTYKGAIYENIVGDMLVKQGYNLYYYSSDRPSLEMDFFVRDADSLIPVEVKASLPFCVKNKGVVNFSSEKAPHFFFFTNFVH